MPTLTSIVVPMLDERSNIEACLDTLAAQTVGTDAIEVLVVDGGSTDGSRELVMARATRSSWVRLVDNPKRRASAAFNRGIEAANGDFIALVSAHGAVGPDFVERSLAALGETGAAGVGGRLEHRGTNSRSRAIGLAMTSRFGMGSPFRFGDHRMVVDTIGHPVYRRAIFETVGLFDESLERNSDYELNYRVRQEGYELVFDPGIVSVYQPRDDLLGLARQFWHYGRGKAVVLRRHPRSLQLRHLAPVGLVAGVIASPALVARPAGRRVVAIALAAYAAVLGLATRHADLRRRDADPVTYVLAFPVMHLSWGGGVIYGAIRRGR